MYKRQPYIFTERNGIYIIDLQKTVKKIEEAYDFMKEVSASGKPILFVGTKKQAQNAIVDEAKRCGQYYVSERWLGGMLTNYKTISGRIKRLADINKMEEDGTFDKLSKMCIRDSHTLDEIKANTALLTSGIESIDHQDLGLVVNRYELPETGGSGSLPCLLYTSGRQ